MSDALEFVPLTVDELQEYFPQYEILSFIAAGGMGAVYLANQISIDRRVAIKVLPKEMSSNEEFSSQFRAEAKVMSKLNHPNLIGFFDFGEVHEMLFIVMEFVDGKSLHHSAHGEAIEQDTALEVAIGITEGIHHAHTAGILHRDIKPANVLLDQNAFPKLGDFGLARPVEESEAGKVIFGTPGYTAPEVVEDPASIDERSDIYSIGAILYELLTGHLPEKKYLPPSRLRNIDPAFDKVVQKAIAFDPDLRYPNTGAFLKDLKKMKLFHERGHVAPTATAPISAPKLEADVPDAKLSTGAKNAMTPVTPVKSAASANNRNIAIIAGAAALLLGGYSLSKVNSKKEDVAPVVSTPTEEKVEVAKPAVIPNKEAEEAKKLAEAKKKQTPIASLESLSKALSKGDLSALPKSTKVHGKTMRGFFLYDIPRDWYTAQMIAENFGGYLGCADSSEVRAFLLDQMRDKEPSVWLGGGTAGDSGLRWINGKKWNFPDADDTIDGYVSLSDNGFIKCEDPKEEKPFFICWNLDGQQEGSLNRQLYRIKKTAKDEKPNLPPGAIMTNKSIYMIKMKRMDWQAAHVAAKKLNATLAIPKDSVEDTFLSSLVLNYVEEGKGVWMGGTVKANGSARWGENNEGPSISRWIEQPALGSSDRGVVFVNGDKVGWLAKPKTIKTTGMILEWKRTKKQAPVKEVVPEKAAPIELIPEGYVLELLEKAKAANASRKKDRLEKQAENISDAKSALSKWVVSLSDEQQKEVEDQVTAFFIKAEDKVSIPTPENTRLPEAAKKALTPFLETQKEFTDEYNADLLELKSAMVKRIQSESAEELNEGNKNLSKSLTEASEKISAMDSEGFQDLLDQK